MPELPEVETWRALAERHLAGKRIASVATVPDPIVFSGIAPRRFASSLRGREITAAHRRGKQLWFALDRRPWPAFHFGMTGSFRVYQSRRDRPRFWKVEIRTEDGTRLAMTNARRLGRIRLLDDPPTEPPISRLGFDPFLDLPTAARLRTSLEARRGPIKTVLLDQSLFAGVGNWLADEVLYQARIHPQRPAYTLLPSEVACLRSKLRAIVRKAVAVEADASRFPTTWLFHHRWGKRPDAVTSRGDRVAFTTIGGRTTAWVPAVQKQ